MQLVPIADREIIIVDITKRNVRIGHEYDTLLSRSLMKDAVL